MQQLKPQSQTQPIEYGPPPLAHQILEPHTTNFQNLKKVLTNSLKTCNKLICYLQIYK
jgi:hypothetical protein